MNVGHYSFGPTEFILFLFKERSGTPTGNRFHPSRAQIFSLSQGS
jgi:hypothetical protein